MVRRLIWLGFVLRVIVAFWNAYFGPTIGAGGDAVGFHDIAVAFSRTLRPDPFHFGVLYSYGLGVLYRLTYPSLFLGGVFSALAWALSAYVLVHIMRLLDFRGPQRTVVMALYALYPASILLTGVTLREAYQLLAVNAALYASLRIYLHGSRTCWLLLAASALGGGLLQPGIFVFGVFAAVATAIWVLFKSRGRIRWKQTAVAIPFIAICIWAGAGLFLRLYNYQMEDGLAGAIESYQRGGLSIGARTHYKTEVDIGGTGGFVGFVLAGLFQYLFEPMPWRPLMLIDIPTVFENFLRAVLIWQALLALLVMPHNRRIPAALIFACYLALELLFSVGTVNWGTAARHHVPSLGLLLVCAFARSRRRQRSPISDRPPEQLVPVRAASG
jgi:hypothetical protein